MPGDEMWSFMQAAYTAVAKPLTLLFEQDGVQQRTVGSAVLQAPIAQKAACVKLLVGLQGDFIGKATAKYPGSGYGSNSNSSRPISAAVWQYAGRRACKLPASYRQLLQLLGCSYRVLLFAAVESPRKHRADSVAPGEAEAPAVALALYCEAVQALLEQQQQQQFVSSHQSSPAATAAAAVAATGVPQKTLTLHQQMLLVLLPWAAAVEPGTVACKFCLANAMDACAAALNLLPTTHGCTTMSPAQDVLMQQQSG
jgi:hypothetical protein